MPNIRKPIFIVPYDLGTLATGNGAAGFPVSSLNRHRDTGLVWKSSGNTNLWVRCFLGSTKPIDFISLTGTNASSSTTIRVRLGTTQAEVDGAAPYDSGSNTIAYSGGLASNGFFHSHLELPSVQNASWLRIDIGSHTGDFQANSLVVGQKFEPSGFYEPDFEYGVIPLGSIDYSRNGVADERPGNFHRSLKFTMSWITEADYENGFRPIIERAAGMILFVCFDPEPGIYRNRKTYLGHLGKPVFSRGLVKPGRLTQEWEMRSVI